MLGDIDETEAPCFPFFRHCRRWYPTFTTTYYVTKDYGSRSDRSRDVADGHETPFSIKLSQVRELTGSKSRDDLDRMTSGDLNAVVEDTGSNSHRCEFFLKQKKNTKKHHLDNSVFQKTLKRPKTKSAGVFTQLLRKMRTHKPLVFGIPLIEACDENSELPEPIIRLMVLVYQRGPNLSGIMRKGNNANLGRTIKEKIKSGESFTLEDHQAPTAASVFKEFLRSIPGSLLTSELHDEWITVQKSDPDDEKTEKIRIILAKLPPAHYNVVKLTICLLQHLAKHQQKTQMGPSNLATCIAPSFCKLEPVDNKASTDLEHVQSSLMEITNVFNPLICFMIIKHKDIFGNDILDMFVKYGCDSSPSISLDEDRLDTRVSSHTEEEEEEEDEEDDDEMMVEDDDEEMEEEDDEGFNNHQQLNRLRMHQQQQPKRQHLQRDSNSGTDSDSMHSVLSMPDTGFRRDDSSMDSLVDREYFPNETESSPKASKSHLSPSNLSRDSGLTLSDTQLYDEDVCHHDTSGKSYQRSTSGTTYDQHDMEIHDAGYYSRSMGHDRRVLPVPPPRKKGNKRPDPVNISERDLPVYPMTTTHHRPFPFKHSASTTQLDISHVKKAVGDLRPMHTHPPFAKRISNDSIGEEDETSCSQNSIDFQKLQKATDIGTLVKSDSGTHLFLGDEMLPTKYNLGPAIGKTQQVNPRFITQSSVTDSTPPMSPQSRFSQGSRDSVMSDSTYVSRESSVYSAPQTPDEPPEKSLSWTRDTEPAFKAWDGRLGHSLNVETSHPFSKSTSDLITRDYDDDEEAMYKPPSPMYWPGKSHEAEEIEMRRHTPPLSLMVTSDDYSLDTSRRQTSPQYSKYTLAQQLVKGSPPPNVILKSLQPSSSKRDSVPMKASHDSAIVAQVRRCSTDFSDNAPFDAVKSIASIKQEEYFTVTPKSIMISPLNNSVSNTSASANKTKLSKHVDSIVDETPTPTIEKDNSQSDSKRPDKPPNYHQALQRNFMIKHSIPVDITSDETEKQREVSARAKALYEQSLQRYNEQRAGKSPERCALSPDSSTKVKRGSASLSLSPKDNELKSKHISVIEEQCARNEDTLNLQNSSSFEPKRKLSSSFDDSSSAFLDMGSISHSLQKDIVNRRNALGKDEVSLDSSYYAGSNLSRVNSKLSDTGSSSGSSVTVSTLSRNSDSFSRRSDISNVSNVTVSSVTSSENSSDNQSVKSQCRLSSDLDQRNMAYSRHFRPLEPEKLSPQQDVDNFSRRSSSVEEEDSYVQLRNKDPRQVYLESMKKYEQHDEHSPLSQSTPSFSSSPSKPSAHLAESSHPQLSRQRPVSHSAPRSYPNPQHSTLSPTSTQSTNSYFNQPLPSRRTSLEVPNSDSTFIHRRVSDSADHLNKIGAYSPRSIMNKAPPLANQRKGISMEEATPSQRRNVSQNDEEKTSGKKPYDKKPSEHRHNFLKARSYFYHPEDEKIPSPNVSQRPSAFSPLSSSMSTLTSKTTINSKKSCVESVRPEDKSVDSAYNLSPRSRAITPRDRHVDSNGRKNSPRFVGGRAKQELPWSVKDLKSIYDRSSGNKGAMNPILSSSTSSLSSISSQQHHRNPPPYQDPPPFQRLQDNNRLSTSSNSSVGSDQTSRRRLSSTSSTEVSHHRLGPQCNGLDSSNCWSSSEDGYSSSLDRQSVKSSSSNKDKEAISDYTNITYV